MLRLTLAAALFAAMTASSIIPAHAGTDCGNGNNFSNPGNASRSCGGGNDDNSGGNNGSSPAPLPLAGIPALIALAGGAGAVSLRRRAR